MKTIVMCPAHALECRCCLCDDAHVAERAEWPLKAMTIDVSATGEIPMLLLRQAE